MVLTLIQLGNLSSWFVEELVNVTWCCRVIDVDYGHIIANLLVRIHRCVDGWFNPDFNQINSVLIEDCSKVSVACEIIQLESETYIHLYCGRCGRECRKVVQLRTKRHTPSR